MFGRVTRVTRLGHSSPFGLLFKNSMETKSFAQMYLWRLSTQKIILEANSYVVSVKTSLSILATLTKNWATFYSNQLVTLVSNIVFVVERY